MYQKQDEIKKFLFNKNDSEILSWFENDDDLKTPNFKIFKAFFEAYFAFNVNDLEEKEYLPITKKEAAILLDIIDIYNEENDNINISSIIKDNLIIEKILTTEKVKNYLLSKQQENDINLKEYILEIIKTISDSKYISTINKVDNVIEICADDNKYANISHICLYIDDIDNFKNSFDDFIKFVEEDIIPFEVVKDVIDFNYKSRYVEEEKQYFIGFLRDLQKNNAYKEYPEIVSKFIKLFRKANLYKKYYHTIRVVYMSNLTCLKMNLTGFIKELVLVSALQHDIGRFYQGAHYDVYTEKFLQEDESAYGLNYGDVKKIEKYTHPIVGYILGLNSLIVFDEKKKNDLTETFDAMAHLISFVINIHQIPNSKAEFLDNIDFELIRDKEDIGIKNNIKKWIIKVYDISRQKNNHLQHHKFFYNTTDNNKFYDELLSPENVYIKELLKNYNKELEKIKENLKNQNNPDVLEYDFAETLKEILSGKSKKELQEMEGFDTFKSLINLVALVVMDIDKIDILIQCSDSLLDNENYKATIPIHIHPEIKKIDLIELLGLVTLEDSTKQQIKDLLSDKKFGLNIETNDGIIINVEQKDKILFPIEILNKLENNLDISGLSNNSLRMKKLTLNDDLIKDYLCLDEKVSANYKNKMKAGNSIQILWWRLNEFIMKNMRIKYSFQTIKDIDLLNQIYNHFNNLNPDFAQLLKPILYVCQRYIDIVLSRSDDLITANISNEIRTQIGTEIRLLCDNNIDNTDDLFVTLIRKYDESQVSMGENNKNL